MVAEFRKMIFSFFELKKAIELIHKDKSLPFPEGDIMAINLFEKPTVSAKVQVASARTADIKIVDLDDNMLAASMLYYCKQKKIPIPKNASKEIVKSDEGLVLHVSISG